MSPSIYNLSRNDFYRGWTLETYDEYWSFLQDRDLENIKKLIEFSISTEKKEDFRWIIEVDAIQYYVGVFPDEKCIRLASKNLKYELVLIEYYPKIENKNILDLKEFIHKMATILIMNTPALIDYISYQYDLPLFESSDDYKVSALERGLSEKIVKEIGKYKKSLFEKMSDFGLSLTANFMLVRVHLLKYLAILPSLDHDKHGTEVKRIFLETLRRLIKDSKTAEFKKLSGQKRALPKVYIYIASIILKIADIVPPKILAYLIRKSVSIMATRFIAGENMSQAQNSLEGLLNTGRDATLDQLGELVVSHKEAEEYTEKVLSLINGFEHFIKKGSRNKAGILQAHVSIKVSALCHDFNHKDFNYTFDQVAPRLRRILKQAQLKEVFINIDAEHYHYRDMVLEIYGLVLEEEDFKNYADTGIVLQAYLKDAYLHFLDILSVAKKRELIMPIRLVKGAYWDAETIEADAHNYETPQFLNKEETDIHFRQLIFKTLENGKYLQLAVASHNIQDHAFASVLRENQFPNSPQIEHQCLHMTYEGLSNALAKLNFATRNYIPIGNLLVGMAYLVRRIMENSSQVGVLTIMRSHKKNLPIKSPYQILKEKLYSGEYIYEKGLSSSSNAFKNIYPLRTYKAKHIKSFNTALDKVKQNLEQGNLFYSQGDREVYSTSYPDLLLSKVRYDSVSEVSEKIDLLFKGYESKDWSSDGIHRFSILLKVADELIEKREMLSAMIMYEAGKSIEEALADVDEAIDFINFYCREQISYQKEYNVEPLGVVGVIAPWNFPLAIPVGMTIAPLVAGNSVLLKPAEQTPIIAKKFIEICYECGVPESVLQLSLGEAEVGKAIVSHELINGIVFTGSKLVGTSIYNQLLGKFTSDRYPFAPRPKLVITEMGGKNAIVVTNNCELDETIAGILYSSFAHAGQKCSAASRILIDEEVKEAFLARFIEAVKNIKIGVADDYSTFINPLISAEDKKRVQEIAKAANQEVLKFNGTTHLDYTQNEYPGYCVGPAVFELDAKTVLNNETYASKEIFGPIVHIIPFKTLSQAVEIFNSTEYALTGGIFGQSQDDIDFLLPRLDVGNIYINRSNTGARVGIEPFGGFKMSGTGPKAGSSDYIKRFNYPKSFTIYTEQSRLTGVNTSHIDVMSSGLSEMKKNETIKNCLEKLIAEFEVYFQIVKEEQKKKLYKLLKAISSNKFYLEKREFPNVRIPGQISYSKKARPLGLGVVVDYNEKLSIELVLDVFVNLLVGNGLIINAQNESVFKAWESLLNLLYKNGVSIYNISLIKMKSDVPSETSFDFIISSHRLNEDFYNLIQSKGENKLIKIFYSGRYFTFDERIDAFTHTQAYAINTMRHGAPLDLVL